jgi:hypothetical protein
VNAFFRRHARRPLLRTRVDTGPDNLYIWGMVKDAALRLVAEKDGFSAAVREGIEQADRGELIDDEEVRLWLKRQEHGWKSHTLKERSAEDGES